MKLPLALLLLSAVPLSAQTRTSENIVVKVVVTLVKVGAPGQPPVSTPGTPGSPITDPGDPTTPTGPTTPTDPAGPTDPGSTGCVNNYPTAVKSMYDVNTALIQAEQLYQQALSQKVISQAAYNSGTQTLSLVNVDNSDVRDLIRIDGPTDKITKDITFVSAEIATLPGVLGTTGSLNKSLTSLATSMQTSLGKASALVAKSTCASSVPN